MTSHGYMIWAKLMYSLQIDIYKLPSESRAAVIPADKHISTGKPQVSY